jgi:GNAT superfamily N-acetyltransferase
MPCSRDLPEAWPPFQPGYDSPMDLRESGPHEADLIVRIQAATAIVAYAHIFPIDDPFPAEQMLTRWRGFEGRVLIAEEDGNAIAFVAFDEEQLDALYVLPEFWGRRIGRRLLEAAGNVSRLWVLDDNWQARRFYESHGWRPDGEARKTAFGVGEVLYRRRLP